MIPNHALDANMDKLHEDIWCLRETDEPLDAAVSSAGRRALPVRQG